MKVGVDSVVLGSWTCVKDSINILDVGTGTGLLSLMLAQKNSKCIIDAVEIDKNAYKQACENFENSKFKKQLNCLNVSFQDFESSKKYDLIISNPPYFKANRSKEIQNKSREKARQDLDLNFNELIKKSVDLLTDKGMLNVILPYGELSVEFIEIASSFGLKLSQELLIQPTPKKPINRHALSFDFRTEKCKQQKLLIYEEPGRFSEEFKHLTSEFYVKLS